MLCLEDHQACHSALCHANLPPDRIVELLGSEFTARPEAANPSLPVEAIAKPLSSPPLDEVARRWAGMGNRLDTNG